VSSGGFHFFLLILVLTGQVSRAAIFGADTRQHAFLNTSQGNLARSTAVALLRTNFTHSRSGLVDLMTTPVDQFLCHDEKFSDDPSLSYSCTGFLVAPDILITAGHCAVNAGESHHETETFCEAFSWLFDYQADSSGKTQLSGISPDKLYSCKEIIYAVREDEAPYRDFAVIRLNREVKGRTPYKISTRPFTKLETGLSMIGYPLGTPAKVSLDARVLHNDPLNEHFITNLDAFEGNSGSPVFNAQGEVVGLLIGGSPQPSLVPAAHLQCDRYNVCAEDGSNCTLPDDGLQSLPGFQTTGSIVQRIDRVLPFLQNSPGSFIGI
jgi:V8-like Glu-specific endopeptidase